MHDDIAEVVRGDFTKVISSRVKPEQLDPDVDMVDEYGLTSLNKVLFLTSVCDDTGVSLSHFTEEDVAGMRTLRNVVDAVSRHAETAV